MGRYPNNLMSGLYALVLALALVISPLQAAMAGFNVSPAPMHNMTQPEPEQHAHGSTDQQLSHGCHCSHSHHGSCCQGHGCATGHCVSPAVAALTRFCWTINYSSVNDFSSSDDHFTSCTGSSLLRPPQA